MSGPSIRSTTWSSLSPAAQFCRFSVCCTLCVIQNVLYNAGKKAELVERALQACPKAGKTALHRLQRETKRQLAQGCSPWLLEQYKLTWEEAHHASNGRFGMSFEDVLDAARAKYGTADSLQQALFMPPRRKACVCGGYHTMSEDSDEEMFDTDESDFYDSEEDYDMLDAQVVNNFLAAAIANPGFYLPFPY